MFVISSGLGLLALVVLALVVVRGVQRRRELAYLLADIVIDVAEALDQRIGLRLYEAGRWTAEQRFLRFIYNPLFRVSWAIEEALRDRSFGRAGFQSYAAASPVDPYPYFDDDLDYLDDTRSTDDYRYDY